jgi:hypothetical protein
MPTIYEIKRQQKSQQQNNEKVAKRSEEEDDEEEEEEEEGGETEKEEVSATASVSAAYASSSPSFSSSASSDTFVHRGSDVGDLGLGLGLSLDQPVYFGSSVSSVYDVPVTPFNPALAIKEFEESNEQQQNSSTPVYSLSPISFTPLNVSDLFQMQYNDTPVHTPSPVVVVDNVNVSPAPAPVDVAVSEQATAAPAQAPTPALTPLTSVFSLIEWRAFVGDEHTYDALVCRFLTGYHVLHFIDVAAVPDWEDLPKYVLSALKARCAAYIKAKGIVLAEY